MFESEVWAKVPFHFWSAVLFWFGCMVGSFLNVCIYRMPLNKSVISPPSHCPHCNYSIPFYLKPSERGSPEPQREVRVGRAAALESRAPIHAA